MMPREDENPVDTQLEAFLDATRTGKKPLADLELGLADSTMVILSNLPWTIGRRVLLQRDREDGRIARAGRATSPARRGRSDP